MAILDNNLHGNESSSAVTIMPTLDDILHGDNTRHVLAFLDYDDVIALLSVSRGFNSKRSHLTADDSLFIELQQYTPRALVEHLLGWMERDLTGAYTVHSNGDHRLRWGFANWADIGGTRRFEMDLPSSAQGYRGRNRLLKQKFCKVFGCSPAHCFQLCLSLLHNDCPSLPKPEHILWTCLHIRAWGNVASSIDRSVTFVGARDANNFVVKVSRVLAKVSEVFDGTSKRHPLPTSYVARFSPHRVNRSAFYMTSDKLGCEYEFVAAIPSFINPPPTAELTTRPIPIRPGYILDVALRESPPHFAQSRSERQIHFYKERLENELLRVGEKVVITGCPVALVHNLTETALSKGSILQPPFQMVHPLSIEHRQLSAIRSESIRVERMEHFIRNSCILFEPCSRCIAPSRCPSCADGEAQRLNILKFVAHQINIGMAIRAIPTQRDIIREIFAT